MSRFFRFNDKNKFIVRLDDFDYSYVNEMDGLKIVFKPKNEELKLTYNDIETRDKDIVRLARFLNKKEKLE